MIWSRYNLDYQIYSPIITPGQNQSWITENMPKKETKWPKLPLNGYKNAKNWPKITKKWSKIAMKHLIYAPIGPPWSMVNATKRSIPNTCYLPKNGPEITKKGQKRPKVAKKDDFACQNSPLRKCFLRLFSCLSCWPVRAGRSGPFNFDQGLKTWISSD